MPDIEIYTEAYCPYCERAKALLVKKGVSFREFDSPSGSARRAEARQRSGGRTSVPQIFIGQTHIGGCDDLMALEHAKKLDPLLSA